MPFSPAHLAHLQQQITATLASNGISDWERTFLFDMQRKLERFGREARLTDKQHKRLMALTRKPRASVPVRSEPLHHQGRTVLKPWHVWRRVTGRRVRSAISFALPMLVILLLGGQMLVYKATERFPEYVRPLVALTSDEQVSGVVTRVRDGDTIELGGVPIRFGSLDCAERDTSAGRTATARMQELTSGEVLQCFLNGRSSYDRRIGSCRLSDGRDLASVMIGEGYCRRYW